MKIIINKKNLMNFSKDPIKISQTWNVYSGQNCYFKKYVATSGHEEVEKRIERLQANNNPGLCKIHDLFYTDEIKPETFAGYTVTKAEGKNYNELFNEKLSLDELVDIFSDLYIKVKGNEYKNSYVFSDLVTPGNVLWNPSTKENTIIDVDSIQVPGFKPVATSTGIDNTILHSPFGLRKLHLIQDRYGKVDIGLIYKKKFYYSNAKTFTSEINNLSLFVLFYMLATGKNFLQAEVENCENLLNGISIDLLKSGLEEYDLFYSMVLETVDVNTQSKDLFLESLHQLKKRYELADKFGKCSVSKERSFVKKNIKINNK